MIADDRHPLSKEAFGIERRLTAHAGAPRSGYVRAMLLGGVQALSLSVIGWRERTARALSAQR
jgi:hypothetical protein